jgi:hypothetical protein
MALIKRQDGVLHEENVLRIKSLDTAFEAAINCQHWEAACEFGKKLIPGLRKHTFQFNPLIGLAYLKLGKINLYLENFGDATHNAREAIDILKVTHGEESAMIKEQCEGVFRDVADAQARKAEEALRLKNEEKERKRQKRMAEQGSDYDSDEDDDDDEEEDEEEEEEAAA